MNWFRKGLVYIFNELADGIERSTIGTLMMLVCLGYTGYLVFTEGGSDTVENLIMAAYVVGSALLGLNVVFDRRDKSGSQEGQEGQDNRPRSRDRSRKSPSEKDGPPDWRSLLK